MWNAEFKPGAVPAASLEAELRPEPNPLSPKENLEAIASDSGHWDTPPESPEEWRGFE